MVQGFPLEGLPSEQSFVLKSFALNSFALKSFALKATRLKGGEKRFVPVVKGLGIAKDYWSKEQKQEWDRYRKLG